MVRGTILIQIASGRRADLYQNSKTRRKNDQKNYYIISVSLNNSAGYFRT